MHAPNKTGGARNHVFFAHAHTSCRVDGWIAIMDAFGVATDFFYSERFCLYRNVAAVIGTLYVLRLLVCGCCKLYSGFRAFFLAPWGISRTNLRKYGKWAVVTGASEGIGRGYALELAKRGLNVVIMSRSQEKLQKVADEIKEKYGRDVRIIAVDFSDGQEIYPKIAEELQDLDVGVLVNNVGLSYEHPEYLADVPEKRLRDVVELNCQSMVQMTRLLLPRMVEKKRGVIVNISSAAANNPLPLLGVYSATKIFVVYFSEALRKEYSNKGIVTQTVTPFIVSTAMSGVRKAHLTIPAAGAYAKAAVATIGIQRTTYGCFIHAVMGYISMWLPGFVLDHLFWSNLLETRSRALRKKAKMQ